MVAHPPSRGVSRALVLAGGGPLVVAWQLGVLRGLGDVDDALLDAVLAADVVIGTAAGAVVAAHVATGADLDDLFDHEVTGSGTASRPVPASWPRRRLLVVTGDAVPLDASCGRPLDSAVAASLAAGDLPTTRVDLAAGQDRVLVVTPTLPDASSHAADDLDVELDALGSATSHVVHADQPSTDALAGDPTSSTARGDAARAGRTVGRQHAATVARAWGQDLAADLSSPSRPPQTDDPAVDAGHDGEMSQTVDVEPPMTGPDATPADLDEAAAVARRVLTEMDDAGTWMFLHLSRLRLPYWSDDQRALAHDGLVVEPFAHRVETGTWRWAEPAAHADIDVPERERSRTTDDVLARLDPSGHEPLRAVLGAASLDDAEVHEVRLSTYTPEGALPVVLLARGCRPCPDADVDVVVGFAIAGPALP